MVAALVKRIEHLVAIAVFVAVAFGLSTAVVDAEALAGDGSAHAGGQAVVDTAPINRETTAHERSRTGLCKYGSCRSNVNRASDAVATLTHGRDARNHLRNADLSRVNIGKWRIHVVTAGSSCLCAIDANLDAVVREASQGW